MWNVPAVLLGGAVIGLASGVGPAAADPTAAELEAKLQALAQEIDELKGKVDAPDFNVSTKGGIKVESKDKAFSASIGGRVMVDAAFHEEDKTRLGDGTELRRVRLHALGTMFKDYDYKVEVDFADNAVALKDAYLAYTGFSPVKVTVGHFKEPFSLEELTSSRFITFMERAFINEAFVPGQRIGVGVSAGGDHWSANAGVFSGDADDDPPGESDEGYQLTGRVTYAPIAEASEVAHVGFGVRYRDPNAEPVRLRARPESHVTDVRFVDTGTIAKVNDQLALNPELAFVYGPFSVQGEYIHQMVDRDVASGSTLEDSLDFSGWYVFASYFLTGESRNYKPKDGKFDRITPIASFGKPTEKSAMGYGAWEIAVRYARLHLSDDNIRGGGERNVTVGLNWYLNPHVRLMFNYVNVNNDNDALGASSGNLLPGESFKGDDDPDLFMLRAQVDF
jgi:phosphate-selective porin OprO/OprP